MSFLLISIDWSLTPAIVGNSVFQEVTLIMQKN